MTVVAQHGKRDWISPVSDRLCEESRVVLSSSKPYFMMTFFRFITMFKMGNLLLDTGHQNAALKYVHLHDAYSKHKSFQDCHPIKCKTSARFVQLKCLLFTAGTLCTVKQKFFTRYHMIYLDRGRYKPNFPKDTIYVDQRYAREPLSWVQASSHCRNLNGHLPMIHSREELLDLVALIKLSIYIPYTEGIFVHIFEVRLELLVF